MAQERTARSGADKVEVFRQGVLVCNSGCSNTRWGGSRGACWLCLQRRRHFAFSI